MVNGATRAEAARITGQALRSCKSRVAPKYTNNAVRDIPKGAEISFKPLPKSTQELLASLKHEAPQHTASKKLATESYQNNRIVDVYPPSGLTTQEVNARFSRYTPPSPEILAKLRAEPTP